MEYHLQEGKATRRMCTSFSVAFWIKSSDERILRDIYHGNRVVYTNSYNSSVYIRVHYCCDIHAVDNNYSSVRNKMIKMNG